MIISMTINGKNKNVVEFDIEKDGRYFLKIKKKKYYPFKVANIYSIFKLIFLGFALKR